MIPNFAQRLSGAESMERWNEISKLHLTVVK